MGVLDIVAGLLAVNDAKNKAINDAKKDKDSGYMPNSIKAKAYDSFKDLSSEQQDAVNDKLPFKFPKD